MVKNLEILQVKDVLLQFDKCSIIILVGKLEK